MTKINRFSIKGPLSILKLLIKQSIDRMGISNPIYRLYITPIVIGFCIFACMGGLHILPPDSTDWIMAGFLDPQQAYLGWEFFRHTPLWQFPIGANPALGMDISSSIVFTDSIPLLAIIFKPFSPLLGDVFQYFGFWLMLCYVLQYFFAYKLISYFTADTFIQIIGACFFVLAPAFLMRTTFHLPLSGHWLILAAFCIFFADRFLSWRWLLLLFLAISIEANLFLMVAAVWFCDIIQRLMKKEVKLGHALINFGQGVIIVVLLMWVWGYFMLGPTPKVDQVLLGMNVLAPFIAGISGQGWSKIIPEINLIQGDGFMFLGLGNILLLFSAIFIWFRSPASGMNKATKYTLYILIAVLSIITLSNKIYIGGYKIISYPLFKPFEIFYAVFRGYGRMFWPVYYLIILFSLVVISKISRRVAIVMIALILAVHVYDLSGQLTRIRAFYSTPPTWESPFKSELWHDFAKRYDKVLYVLPGNHPFEFVPLVEYAAVNDLSINMGYFARFDENKIKAARVKLTNELLAGDFDPKALYIFNDKKLWNIAIRKVHDDDLAGVLDGFKVLAPNLNTCRDCSIDIFELQQNILDECYEMPDGIISFNHGGAGSKHLIDGWSGPEPWGTWSDGPEATIRLKLKKVPVGDIALHISGTAFIHKKHPLQRIEVIINDYKLYTIVRDTFAEKTHVILIPKYVYKKSAGEFNITMRFPDAMSPADIDMSGDSRRLSFGLTKIWFSNPAEMPSVR